MTFEEWKNEHLCDDDVQLIDLCEEAFQSGERARAKRDMEIADTYESRIKHTSHRDGLGMGSQCCEKVCRYIYDAIKEVER